MSRLEQVAFRLPERVRGSPLGVQVGFAIIRSTGTGSANSRRYGRHREAVVTVTRVEAQGWST